MEPKIVEFDEMTVVGLQSLISMQHNLISRLWERFFPRMEEIPHVTQPNVCFGVSFDMVEISAKEPGQQLFEFFHLVGRPVDSTEGLPEGMSYKRIPAHKYAKFTHKGSLDTLMSTYDEMFSKWLPGSGYRYDGAACDLEWYDERFKPTGEDSEFDIYLPIV